MRRYLGLLAKAAAVGAAASAAIGITASVAVAAPHPEVYSIPSRNSRHAAISLATHSNVALGHVSLTRVSAGVYDLDVCDARSDGYYISARIDPGNGDVISYNSNGVGELNCYERRITYGIRKFRLAWKDYSSDWELPPN